MAQHPLPVNLDVHAKGPPLKAWQDSVGVVHEVLRQHRGETGENLTTATTTTRPITISPCTKHRRKGGGKGRDPGRVKSELTKARWPPWHENKQAGHRPSSPPGPSECAKRRRKQESPERDERRALGRQSEDAPRAAAGGVCRQARRAMNAKPSLSEYKNNASSWRRSRDIFINESHIADA